MALILQEALALMKEATLRSHSSENTSGMRMPVRCRGWKRTGMVTCVLGANVVLYLCFLHSDKVTGCAANGKHPLLLVHVERHVAYKLDIELCLKSTHMATKTRKEKGKSETAS